MKFFQTRKWRLISRLLASGLRLLADSTTRQVLVAHLPVAVLICLSLMTLIRNRT